MMMLVISNFVVDVFIDGVAIHAVVIAVQVVVVAVAVLWLPRRHLVDRPLQAALGGRAPLIYINAWAGGSGVLWICGEGPVGCGCRLRGRGSSLGVGRRHAFAGGLEPEAGGYVI